MKPHSKGIIATIVTMTVIVSGASMNKQAGCGIPDFIAAVALIPWDGQVFPPMYTLPQVRGVFVPYGTKHVWGNVKQEGFIIRSADEIAPPGFIIRAVWFPNVLLAVNTTYSHWWKGQTGFYWDDSISHFEVDPQLNKTSNTPTYSHQSRSGDHVQPMQSSIESSRADDAQLSTGESIGASKNGSQAYSVMNNHIHEKTAYELHLIHDWYESTYTQAERYAGGNEIGLTQLQVDDLENMVENNRQPYRLSAAIGGPTYLDSGQMGTWTANLVGGAGPFTYHWYYMLTCFAPAAARSGPTTQEVTCNKWHFGGSQSSFSRSVNGSSYDLKLRLIVTDANSDSDVASKYVSIGSGSASMAAKQAGDTSPFNSTILEILTDEIPAEYALDQNYPNPFNPSTRIDFSIPEDGNVKVMVYDASGREVAVLLDDRLKAGVHTVDWNAGRLPSGSYVYVLQAANARISKSMTLVR